MHQEPFLDSLPNLSMHKASFESNTHTVKNSVPVFSILIPTWNNLTFLKCCIASIQKHSRYQHQIVLHLNECKDGTEAWVKEQGFDYSKSTENIGICYAMNIARTLATSDLLVYFNDDMVACPDWDYWLYEEAKQQTTQFYFLSSTMIEPRYTKNTCVIAPMNFGDHPSELNEVALLTQYDKTTVLDWSGATWPPSLVPAVLWDMVGGYSTELSPGMYSDPDFSMKLWQVGVRYFKGVGKSRVYHFMCKSTGKLKSNKKKKINGAKLFLHKWGISANVFTRFYLRRGEPWVGVLTAPKPTLAFTFKVLLNNVKRKLS